MKSTTTLRYVEPVDVPLSIPPRRYGSSSGYVRLRWTVAENEQVECWEHRWVAWAAPGEHVHHINGVKDDNRPENLKIVTPSSHRGEHAVHDPAEMERLYLSGMSTPEVGRAIGADPATVYRALRKRGVTIRTMSESVKQWHAKRGC